jgi:hypothetical protein
MKMKYILAMFLLASIGAKAQIQVDSVSVKKLKLNGNRLTRVSKDTNTANQDSMAVMTEMAVKQMVFGREVSRDVQIAAKVNYTDTAFMLLAYEIAINARLKYSDTAAFLAAYQIALNCRLKYSDSSAMLAAYRTAISLRMKYTDSTAFLAAYQTALNGRMKYTDSVVLLAAYQTAINARIKYSDSASMLSAYQAALNVRLKYTDSALMLSAYRTALLAKQATLVSGSNIKSVNGNSLLGSGDLTITAGLTGNGVVTSSILPVALWSTTNNSLTYPVKVLSQPYDYLCFDSATKNIYLGLNNTSSNVIFHRATNGALVAAVHCQSDGSGAFYSYDGLGNIKGYYASDQTALTSAGIYSWSNVTTGATGGANTTGLSRTANGTVAVGNGTQGDKSGTVIAASFNDNSTPTSLSGATSGTAIFRQPAQGSVKRVIIYCTALVGITITYTFPTVFTQTPVITTTSGLSSSVVTTLTTTGVVITGSTSTGIIIIEGI